MQIRNRKFNKRTESSLLVSRLVKKLPAGFKNVFQKTEDKIMEIPQYLVDALYQFSQDTLKERDEFDALAAKQKAEDIELTKHKESWLEHLFRSSSDK
jgi:hypothetical protein